MHAVITLEAPAMYSKCHLSGGAWALHRCQQIPQCSAGVLKPKDSRILKNNIKNKKPKIKKKEVTLSLAVYFNAIIIKIINEL